MSAPPRVGCNLAHLPRGSAAGAESSAPRANVSYGPAKLPLFRLKMIDDRRTTMGVWFIPETVIGRPASQSGPL